VAATLYKLPPSCGTIAGQTITMSGWTVPLSSSSQAPSTPGSGQRSTTIFANLPNGFTKSPLAPNPSTTPAGPPPSSAASFTPADPPPSSIFASSQLGYGKTLFKSKSSHGANTGLRKGTKPLYTNTIDQKKLARFLNKSADFDFGSSTEDLTKNTFGVPSSSPPHGPPSDVEEESYEDESEVFDEEADAEGSEEEGTMNVDQGSISHLLDPGSVSNGSLKNGESVAFGSEFGSSIMDANPRGTKRTRGGSRISNALPRNTEKTSESHGESDISKIAKSTAGRFGIAKLRERDDFIVGTEAIIKQDLYGSELLGGGHHQPLHAGLPKASEALSNFWWSSSDQDLAGFPPKEETLKGIGPEESAPPVHKAIYLGALLLRLRHPPTAKGKQSLALARLTRSSLHRKPSTPEHTPPNPTAFPKVLLDWLNEYQDPYGLYSNDIESHQPNPTAHKDYWGILYSFTLRGRLSGVINLLKKSNFIHAKTAMEDRRDGQSYSVVQVRNIERVINRAIQVLEHCPASQEDDWNITGNEWIMFRKRVEQALTDLATFAEGRDREMDPTESTFEASNFGLRGTTMDLSQSARRAESRVPWTVYGNLRTIYGIILGRKEEILYMAQDWVEATIALTAWWTGDDDEDMHVKRVPLARQSLGKLESHGMRTVDVNPNAAYLRRLASALKRVNAEGSALAVNTMNPVEVGLASVFEGSIELVVGLLRAWSLPVASAVVEIASAGGWLETEARVLPGLDESDRRLLDSVGPSRKPLTMRDTVLTQYADALSHRGKMTAESISEGWEFSISVLNRLENQGFAMAEIKALLSRLPRGSSMQVDRILQTCERFAITKEARVIAEVC